MNTTDNITEVKERSFVRGVLFALSMMDPKSPDYWHIVEQAGGFEVLREHAEEYDLEHLNEAKRSHEED